jgi:NADP-dependent 3-hydroxy acid dehydrogenase YdfG
VLPQRQAREGAKVALLARNAEEIKAVADAINAEGGVARAYELDIVDRAALPGMIARGAVA